MQEELGKTLTELKSEKQNVETENREQATEGGGGGGGTEASQ